MGGAFDRVASGVRELMGAAMEGAEPDSVRVAVDALRDQWLAAERETREDGTDSFRRFEVVVAMLYGEAYRPAIIAVSEGRKADDELDRASEVARWILRAHNAFTSGSEEVLNLCLRRAERAALRSD
jgi:hypothetical protein